MGTKATFFRSTSYIFSLLLGVGNGWHCVILEQREYPAAADGVQSCVHRVSEGNVICVICSKCSR